MTEAVYNRPAHTPCLLFLLLGFALPATTFGGCGGLFTAPSGVLTSPGYPGLYPNGQDCVYVVERPEGDSISLAFHELDLEDSDHCAADTLEIRDGHSETAPLRYRKCGSEMPQTAIKSFFNAFWIRFTSDDSQTAGGFKITYTAVSEPNGQFFLMSTPKAIDIQHVEGEDSMSLPIPGLYNPGALEFEPRPRRLYWSDQGIGEIRSAFLNGTDWKTLYTHEGKDYSSGLALDPVARLLFFNEVKKGKVIMTSLVTGHQKTILFGLETPYSLVLDYTEGTLFWTELSVSSSASISRSLYDGSQRHKIVTRHLSIPSCLALDPHHKRLYWVDASAQKVEWSDYEGKGRSSQAARYRGTFFYALAVTHTHFRIVDWGAQGVDSKYSIIRQMDKDGSNETAVSIVWSPVMDLYFYDGSTGAAETNGCGGGERGGCSHLCIPVDGEGHVRCVCPDQYVLAADHKTCRPLATGKAQNIRLDNYYNDENFDDEDDWDDEDDDEAAEILHMTAKPPVPKKIPARTENVKKHTQKSNIEQGRSRTKPGNVVISPDDHLNRPITAQVRLTGPQPFETDGSKILPVTCQYEGRGIRYWRPSGQCVQIEDNVCLLRPKVPEDDGKVILCEVYFMDGSYGRSAFTIQLNYPPPSPPRIKGYNPGQILKRGDNLRMTCVVQGGKPLVSAVDFYCPGHPDTELDEESRTYVQASMTIGRLTSSDDGVTCVCSAEWKVPEMYTEKAYVTLRVASRGRTEL